MEFQNRMGHDNFVWWMGVVEDRNDPLELGRCRVRIFGSHTDNLELIPTDSLPWALPVYSPNYSKAYSSPMEGEYVLGFYSDGEAGQFPVMMGVFPGIPQEQPVAGKGFSALASIYNNPEVKKHLDEVEPVVPEVAPANQIIRIGKPTTPTNAYSANGTVLAFTNSNLVHSCDFRFLVDIGNLNIGTIENPYTLIKQAIANAQNKAAAIIRTLLAKLLETFRLPLKGIIAALNLDPTGNLSKIISEVRDVVRTINYYSRKLAEVVGNIALVVALVQQLQQIVEWIKSLPQQVLALLQDCLTTFQNALKSATSQITAIPGQVNSNLLGAFQQLETSAETVISQAQAAANTANIPNTMITLITSPTTANVNVITQYITSEYPNSNVIIANSESASFNIANTSTP